MAEYKLILPPMGEGIMEATITEWVKNEGDYIEEDETIVGIATDKVDSDVPSSISGKLLKKLKEVNDICKIGEAFAIVEIDNIDKSSTSFKSELSLQKDNDLTITTSFTDEIITEELVKPLLSTSNLRPISSTQDRFYSPLIRSICKKENISLSEIEKIQGTGLNGRITKEDLLSYLKDKNTQTAIEKTSEALDSSFLSTSSFISDSDEIIEMNICSCYLFC